jgi:hypothetical protein
VEVAACYHVGVSLRVAILIGSAVTVLGALVYLYVAVQAGPTLAAPAAAPDRPIVTHARADDAETRPGARDRAASITPTPQMPTAPSEPVPIATDLATDPTLELDTAMAEANRLYDRSEHDAAQEAALRILERSPGNVRMLRIVVSTACFMGEPEKAQKYWLELPDRDREQMAVRCGRIGVAFKP